MNKKNILILLDGEPPTKDVVAHFSKMCDVIIVTDGAARYVKEMGVSPNVIIGDLDSLDIQTQHFYQRNNVMIIKDTSQYSNDFEKALDYTIANFKLKSITVLGIHGKRTDHLLTNFSVLLRYSRMFDAISAYDATHKHFYLRENVLHTTIESIELTEISLTPVPIAHNVQTSGLLYPISGEDMVFGEREGLSNIVNVSPASITISSGALLISVPFTINK